MTVNTRSNTSNATGDGSQTSFSFSFAIQQAADMDVYLAGVLQSSGYTVNINSSGVGGTVVFSSAPANAVAIIMQRICDYTQGLALPTEGNIPETSLENAYDKLTMLCQQLEEKASRALSIALGTTGVGTTLPTPEALRLLRWNAGATALENTDAVGDMIGPTTSTNNAIVLWDGATGALTKDGPGPDTLGLPLLAQGAGSAPAFGALSLSGTAVTGILPAAKQHASTAYTDVANGWSTSQLPASPNAIDLGSTAIPFRNLFLGTASTGTKFVSAASGAERTVTFPDANSNTVVPSAAVGNQFLTAISSGGVISRAQPAFSDLSGVATAAQLPNPGAASLGGVQSKAAVANNFLTAIGTDGVVAAAQPAFSNLSGNIAVTQMNSGTDASGSTFFRGDGTWSTPAGAGDVTGPATSTDRTLALWNGAGGDTLKDGPAIGTKWHGLLSGGAGADPAFAHPVFGGQGERTAPTTGTLTGEYWHDGNWTTTGPITATRLRLHVRGTVTIDHAITVSTELAGGAASGAVATSPGGNGTGFGAGTGAQPYDSTANPNGGGGGGFGGAGGNGGGGADAGRGARGGGAYNITTCLVGSSGGAGSSNNTPTAGGAGGAGGGGLYIEATGAIVVNADITADGSAGSVGGGGGGGGSGGGVDIRSLSTVTINAGDTIFARGGAGGAAGGAGGGGGGGGGGYVAVHGSAVTNNGTITVSAGAGGAGTGGGTNGIAGSAGVSLAESTVWGIRTAV